LSAGYDYLCKIVTLFPKCTSTISDDMLLDVRFKHNILKAITAYVSEEVKTKSIRDINKELGGLLSFKTEITENVPDYIAGVQNLFDVSGKQEALKQFPEKEDMITDKLKCNEKSELLPPSKRVAVLAEGVAGDVQKTDEQESEEVRISQEKETQTQIELIDMVEKFIESMEAEQEQELQESMKEEEESLRQQVEEKKNKEKQKEEDKDTEEMERELEELMMARAYTKHDD